MTIPSFQDLRCLWW